MPDYVPMMISIPSKYAGLTGSWVYQGRECNPLGLVYEDKNFSVNRHLQAANSLLSGTGQ
jgi:hypothetical protein